MPKISVITVNLNNAGGLESTIRSVASQSSCDFEFIVIDGGSTDRSREVVQKYSANITHQVSEKDNGIYEAMNKGIRISKGEYLLFLNSGDTLYDEHVLKNIAADLNGEGVVSGDLMLHHGGEWHHVKSQDDPSISYFRSISLYHQATFVRKSVFDEYGLYDESFRIGGDYEFFIRVLLKNKVGYKHVNLLVCRYTADGISNQEQHLPLNLKEKEKAWAQNFNPLVLKDLDELYYLKESKFYWILNKTRNKGFFYWFFSFITAFFLFGYRILEKLRLTKK